MTALDLLKQLHDLGIILVPYPDGTLHCRGARGILTPALVERMRKHKAELHALVENWSERAAIAQYCGGLTRVDAEQLGWAFVLREEAAYAMSVVQAASVEGTARPGAHGAQARRDGRARRAVGARSGVVQGA